MQFDPDWNEELIIHLDKLNDDAAHENGDITMLEELHRQEEEFAESIQQFTERELSKLNGLNDVQVDTQWGHFANYSNFSPDKTFSSTFFQESTNHESTLQVEDDFINLLLQNEDIMLVENQLSVDCGTIDYNDKLDYEKINEFQEDPIPTEYLAIVDSSLEAIDDPKINSQARVCLERLPEPITKVKDTAEVAIDQRIKLNDRKKSALRYCHKCKKFDIDQLRVSMPKNCRDCGNLMIYSCKKCMAKYFVTYSAMTFHRKICKSKKKSTDVPSSLVLYDCRDCKFRTLHNVSIVRHLRKTQHRLKDADGDLQINLNTTNRDAKYTKQFEDYSKAFLRFCKNCNELELSVSNADDYLCKKCNSHMFYYCIKCRATSKHYKTLIYHLEKSCLRRKYICCKCNFVTSTWKILQRHIKGHHTP